MLQSLASTLREQLQSLIHPVCQDTLSADSSPIPLAKQIANIEKIVLAVHLTSKNEISHAFHSWDTREADAPGTGPLRTSSVLIRWAISGLLQVALWEEREGRRASARYLRAQARSWQKQLLPDWCVELESLELPIGCGPLRLERVPEGDGALDPELLSWLQRLPLPDVGPDHDPKLRLTRMTLESSLRDQSSACTLQVGSSTWTLGRGFHRLLEQPDLPTAFKGRLLDLLCGQLSGVSPVPDILAVHLVCLTADQQLVLLRRSNLVAYAPGHWSLSLEEQVSLSDFAPVQPSAPDSPSIPGPLAQAAARAVWEELGVALTGPRQVSSLGLYLDLRVLSIGLMALANLPQRAAELQSLWQARAEGSRAEGGLRPSSGSDAWEADALAFIPLSQLRAHTRSFGREGLSGFLGKEPLHPTALLRLSLLTRTAGFDDSVTIC